MCYKSVVSFNKLVKNNDHRQGLEALKSSKTIANGRLYFSLFGFTNYIMPGMPPPIAGPASLEGMSTTAASVVRNMAEMDAAF